jgi:hypothetical protein
LVNLGGTGIQAIIPELCFLFAGAIITCLGASLLLRRVQDR